MEYLIAFALFQVKHYLADFPLQRKRHLEKFSKNPIEQAKALVDHCAIHSLGTFSVFGIMYIFVTDYPPALYAFIMLVAALTDGIFHYLIDLWKVEFSRGYTTSDPEFWYLLGKDQMFHQFTYIGLTAWVFINVNNGVL